ncbi:hypothetical protein JCM10296v2_000403 [Rhodotorula toruloides]
MSHLDAPLRSRRQHPSSDIFSRREAGVITPEDTFPALDIDLDLSSSPPSSSSFAAGTRSLKSLLLPAQIELRRVFHRQRRRDLPSNERDVEARAPKRFKTDSSFHLHHVHHLDERQTRTSTTTAQLGAALSNVGAGTDCQAFADRYGDTRRTQVLLGCARAKAAAVMASQEASSSRAAAAASTSTSRRIRTSTTTSRRLTRTSTAPRDAATPRLAAPVPTPLSPAQVSALSRSVIGSVVSEQFSQAASVVASRVSVASASRAVLMSSVDSIFSEAASVVASRQGLLPTVTSASSASSASSSTPSSASASSTPAASSSSSIASSATPSTADPARSNHNRIAKIVGPSVAVPLGLLLLALVLFCCLKRRRRKTGTGYTASGRSTPGGLGPISHPQPLQPTNAAGGAMREYGAMGAGAGLAGLGAAAAGRAGGRTGEPGSSQESLGPTPSAIGVAFSEPRTKWGRRSLVDVLAGGVRGANSGSNTPEGSAVDESGGHQRGLSTSSSFGGRQPSIRSSASIPSELRGVGGYNIYGYQPGQPRPVMSMTSPLSSHYDPFGPGAIVPVPESARSMHPVSSEEGSISGYSEGPGASGSGGGRSGSGESFTAVLAPPLAAGYAHSRQAQQSRTTQQTSEGEQGYWTADPGQSSVDTHTQEAGDYEEAEEELSGLSGSPEEEAVNFGSGSSSSGSGAGSRMSEDPNSTPRLGGSRTSTPRLGMGHGSIGSRRNDGTGSWWNA